MLDLDQAHQPTHSVLDERAAGAHPEQEQFYRRYWGELCSYLRRRFGPGPPEPEDVAQSAFARLAELGASSGIRDRRAFLFTIACNLVLDEKRRRRTQGRCIDEDLRSAGEVLEEITPERVLLERERFEILAAAIKRLPRKQQRVLILSRYHGETYAQISKRTGWSLADISRQVTRALAALDAALGGAEAKDGKR